jgi:hypothetical protein
MHPAGRLVMACFAVFFGWTLVRAWREGVIHSRGWSFSADDNPVAYTLAFVAHAACMALFVAVSAGYTPDEIWHFVGLSGEAPR